AVFLSLLPTHPSSTLFPYTTLFRSIWFPIGYLVRLYFVTMVEPSLNPLKLPLASLAAKFMFPLYIGLLTPFSDSQKGVIGLMERSEEHTSELQSRFDLVCRLLLEKK